MARRFTTLPMRRSPTRVPATVTLPGRISTIGMLPASPNVTPLVLSTRHPMGSGRHPSWAVTDAPALMS